MWLIIDGREWLARESRDPDFSDCFGHEREGPQSQRNTDKIQALHK